MPNLALVITDGRSNVDVQSTPTEAQRLKDSGVTVYTIGVTSEPSVSELTMIASRPEYVLPLVDYSNLTSIAFLDFVMDAICTPDARPASEEFECHFVLCYDYASLNLFNLFSLPT